MYAPNAGNIGHTLPIVEVIYKQMGFNVVTFSYRGYGLSTGGPSETGIKLDAQAVLRYLADHPQIKKTKLVLYGRSLGGAVAIYTASLPLAVSSHFVSGIILENTFLSIVKLIPSVLPIFKPFGFLVTQRWESDKIIQNLDPKINLLFFSGSKDELVPPEQHKKLFDLAPSKSKFFKPLAEGTHNDTVVQPGYWKEFNKFCVICDAGSNYGATNIGADDDGIDVRIEDNNKSLNEEKENYGDFLGGIDGDGGVGGSGFSEKELEEYLNNEGIKGFAEHLDIVDDDDNNNDNNSNSTNSSSTIKQRNITIKNNNNNIIDKEKTDWVPLTNVDQVKAASITNIKDTISSSSSKKKKN